MTDTEKNEKNQKNPFPFSIYICQSFNKFLQIY